MATGTNLLSAAERSIRSVFVGNIPYEATEEQLKDIFSEVGPVVSFRLVYDRETGKPKGYGFCEYKDQETALSAMRNLNGYELNGRALRVDNAASEKSKEELKNLQSTLGGPPVESPYGPEVDPNQAPEVIAKVMVTLPPIRMYETMKEMKMCIQNNPNETRNLLLQNPQLAYALLQAAVVMKIVDPATAVGFLHQNNVSRETQSTVTTQGSQSAVRPPQPQVFNNMVHNIEGVTRPMAQSTVGNIPPMVQNSGNSMQAVPRNIGVNAQPMISTTLNSVGNTFKTQQQVSIASVNEQPSIPSYGPGRVDAIRGFQGMSSASSQLQTNSTMSIDRAVPSITQVPPFNEHPVGLNNNPSQPLPVPPPPPKFLEKAMGDRDMRQPVNVRPPVRQPSSDRDMREPFGLGDKDMRSLTTDQDLRTMSLSQIVVEKLCPVDTHYSRPSTGSQPVVPVPFNPPTGHKPTIFDQRHSFNSPTPSASSPSVSQSSQQKQNNVASVSAGSKTISQAPAPAPSPGMPSSASLAQVASGLVPNDQEKAALILQVLQLSDQQIAVLPPEQRQSIMILKEQFARSTQGN